MKYVILVGVLGITFSLIGLSIVGSSTDEDTIYLRVAENQPYDYPTAQAIDYMGKQLQHYSKGQMQLKLYAGGQLGAEKDTVLANRLNAIDINRVSLSVFNNIEPVTTIPSLPFIFESEEHLHKVLDSEIGGEILQSLEPYGLVGLAFYDSGARSFYNIKKPIHTPRDMVGLKIRVQNTDVSVAMVKALGACPTPMGFGEVYEALVTGVIDGAENNLPSYRTTRHFEVAKHYTFDQHMMTPEILTVSKKVWDNLSSEQRDYIKMAARDSVIKMRDCWKKEVSSAQMELINSENKFVEGVDKSLFIEAMEPVYQKFANTPALIDLKRRIQSVR